MASNRERDMYHVRLNERSAKHGAAGMPTRGGLVPRFRVPGAFTLIELLTVVAIIALLIAILLPSLRSAREQGKCTVCLSNMRQIGLAMQDYAMQNREAIPAMACPAYSAPEENYWLCVLQRYANQPLIARCLNDKTERPFLDWSDPPGDHDTWKDYRWSSYAINACLVVLPNTDPDEVYPPRRDRLNRIPHPESVIYLAEVRSGGGEYEWDSADHIHADLWDSPEDPKNKGVAWDRHLKESNYLFADGHVGTLDWKKTWNMDGWPESGTNLWWPSHAPFWPPPPEPPR
jgi:prepilin-type processing-associated H-X9-DG protein/prepilin-type N-terminal cleavage/methylation domain-containing protein